MKKFAFAMLSAALLATTANAASVSIDVEYLPVPQAAIDAGAPEGTTINVFATTDADILSIGRAMVDLSFGAPGELFNVAPPFGSNDTPPDPAFIAFNEALLADSWITTPGDTTRLGADLPGDNNTTFGDLSNDGPQNMFQFASLTVPTGTWGFFSGQVTVAGSAGPESFDFRIVVPEPATMMLVSLGLVGVVAARRRS